MASQKGNTVQYEHHQLVTSLPICHSASSEYVTVTFNKGRLKLIKDKPVIVCEVDAISKHARIRSLTAKVIDHDLGQKQASENTRFKFCLPVFSRNKIAS